MSSSPVEPADLFDLKLLPAWVKEPAEPRSYEHYAGEEREGHATDSVLGAIKEIEFKRSAFNSDKSQQELNVQLKPGNPMRTSRKRQGATPKVFASGSARHGGACPRRSRAAPTHGSRRRPPREIGVLRSRKSRWRS